MAVTPKYNEFYDRTTRRQIDVHSISVNRSNKKGAAEACGGKLVENRDKSTFHIKLQTTVNGKKVQRLIYPGDILFRTGNSGRWQVLDRKAFAKRFDVVK